jgi:hypothetical protein
MTHEPMSDPILAALEALNGSQSWREENTPETIAERARRNLP